MIKVTKVLNTAADLATKVGTKIADNVSGSKVSQEVSELAIPSGDLLRSYQGVRTSKLFDSLPKFIETIKIKFESYKDVIPEPLYQKLLNSIEDNNFMLKKAVTEYYSGLEKCKTFEDVKKLYPEINLPNLNFRKELADIMRRTVSKEVCEQVKKLPTPEAKQKFITDYISSQFSKQVETWEMYPEIQKIQKMIADEIVQGKFSGSKVISELKNSAMFNQRMPYKYKLLDVANPEELYIKILKEHFLNGKNITDITVYTDQGNPIDVKILKRHINIPNLDKNFRQFIENTEKTANKFKELSDLSANEIKSAVLTRTWTTSRLRADLSNETKFGKPWSLIRPVWQKTMFPETTFYPTEKLVETYLVNMFRNGKRHAEVNNPIHKILEDPSMNKTKSMLLKRLYKDSKTLDMEKYILNHPAYKKFKAEFDIEAMKKDIESIEEHYKNFFFKMFWTDERKLRFAQALNQNIEQAGQNIEISEKLLTKAMDNVFSEMV